jgi:hypothetical protein
MAGLQNAAGGSQRQLENLDHNEISVDTEELRNPTHHWPQLIRSVKRISQWAISCNERVVNFRMPLSTTVNWKPSLQWADGSNKGITKFWMPVITSSNRKTWLTVIWFFLLLFMIIVTIVVILLLHLPSCLFYMGQWTKSLQSLLYFQSFIFDFLAAPLFFMSSGTGRTILLWIIV